MRSLRHAYSAFGIAVAGHAGPVLVLVLLLMVCSVVLGVVATEVAVVVLIVKTQCEVEATILPTSLATLRDRGRIKYCDCNSFSGG